MLTRTPAIATLLIFALSAGFPDGLGGRRWEPIGPGGGNVAVIAIHPENPEIIYAIAGSEETPFPWGFGVFHSQDGGRTWRPRNRGLPNLRVTSIAIDATAGDTIFVGTRTDGVFRCQSGGEWSAANVGLTDQSVTALAVDRATSTIYLSTASQGVFRSTNGGESWEAFNSSLHDLEISALAVTPADSTVYAGSPRVVVRHLREGSGWEVIDPLWGSEALAVTPDGSAIYSVILERLRLSLDDGDTWTRVGNEQFTPLVTDLAIDRSRPRVIYVGGSQGLFRSKDGGDSWNPLTFPGSDAQASIGALAVASGSPPQLYAGLRLEGIFRSEDGGENWTESNAVVMTR